MWEVETNKKGGHWVITLTKNERRTDSDNIDVLTAIVIIKSTN